MKGQKIVGTETGKSQTKSISVTYIHSLADFMFYLQRKEACVLVTKGMSVGLHTYKARFPP